MRLSSLFHILAVASLVVAAPGVGAEASSSCPTAPVCLDILQPPEECDPSKLPDDPVGTALECLPPVTDNA